MNSGRAEDVYLMKSITQLLTKPKSVVSNYLELPGGGQGFGLQQRPANEIVPW